MALLLVVCSRFHVPHCLVLLASMRVSLAASVWYGWVLARLARSHGVAFWRLVSFKVVAGKMRKSPSANGEPPSLPPLACSEISTRRGIPSRFGSPHAVKLCLVDLVICPQPTRCLPKLPNRRLAAPPPFLIPRNRDSRAGRLVSDRRGNGVRHRKRRHQATSFR